MNQSTPKAQDIDRGERIRSERQRLGLTLVEMAKKAGVSKGSQILYEKGSAPSADYLAAAGSAGADIVFILTGRYGQDFKPRVGTKVQDKDGKVLAEYRGEPGSDGVDRLSQQGFVRLPIYDDVRASAGPGAAVTSEQSEVISFDRAFLRGLGATPDRCSMIWAHGDSMQPTIPDGSILIIDHGQTDVVNGCIYVLNIADDLVVKRVRRRLDATIEIVSDNAMYPPEALRADQLQQLRVVGRVVYLCRTP